MRLYLIRHGQPEIASGVCYGSSDLTVSEQEHGRVMSVVAPLLPKQIPLYSSPLLRCSVLAARLAAIIEAREVIHDPRLAEMHFGAWEMRAWEHVPRAEVDAWARDPVAYCPGGGESVLQVARRVLAFHDDLRARNCDAAVVVCHAGTMRLLSQCTPGTPAADMALHAANSAHMIGYGELLILDC